MENSTLANPYSAPAATDAPPLPSVLYYRQDNFLMIRDGAVLPARCIKTNQPEEPKETKQVQLSWTPPWIYILLPAALLPVLILASAMSKKAKLTYTLCREHRSRLTKRKIFAVLGFLGGAAVLMAGLVYLEGSAAGAVAIIAAIAMIGNLIVIGVSNAITVRKHKDGWFTIKGCSPEFLNSL